LTDHVGHGAAIAETDFEHMIARYHSQKSDSLRVCRLVGLVEPVCDRDTDLAFRVAKLACTLSWCELLKNGHRCHKS